MSGLKKEEDVMSVNDSVVVREIEWIIAKIERGEWLTEGEHWLMEEWE